MMLRKLMLTVTGILFSLQVQALGLSRIEVYSKLNEPLSAKIEVVSVPKGESGNIRINLASNESFRRAGLDRPQILSSLRFSVQPTGKNGATIRLSSPQPLREPFLNFLLEVTWPSGRILREYTVLLDPPLYEKKLQAISPPPAPMARTLAAETPARATRATRAATRAARAATTTDKSKAKPSARKPRAPRSNRGTTGRRGSSGGGGSYNVSANDTLWQIANSTRPQSVSLQRHMDNIYYANPGAFVRRNMNLIQAGRSIKIPGWDGQQVEPPPPSMAKTNTQGPIRTAENTESAPISEPPAPAPDKMPMAAEPKVVLKPAPGSNQNNSATTSDAQVADENKELKKQLSDLKTLFDSTKDRLNQVDKDLINLKVQSQQFAELQKNFNKQAEELKKANQAKQAAEQAAKAAKQELDKAKKEAERKLAEANKAKQAVEQELAKAKAAAKAVPPTTVAEAKLEPKPDTTIKTVPGQTPPNEAPVTEVKIPLAPPPAKGEEKPATTTPTDSATAKSGSQTNETTPATPVLAPGPESPSLVEDKEKEPTPATESPTTKDTEKPSEATEETKTATEAKTEESTDTKGKEDNTTTGTDQQPPSPSSPAGTHVSPLDKPVVPPVVAEAGLMDTVNGLVNQVPGGWLTLGGIGGGTVALLLIGGFLRRHRKADGGLAEWTEGTELTEGEVLAELARLEAEAQPQESPTGLGGEDEDDLNKLLRDIGGANLAETPEPVDEELLENVDVYIAYETFDKAEELLKPAIAEHPSIHKYRLKLLEVYAAAKQEERFEEEAKDFYADTDGQSPLWGDVLNLWESLGTGRELDVSDVSIVTTKKSIQSQAAGAKPPLTEVNEDDDSNLGVVAGVAVGAAALGAGAAMALSGDGEESDEEMDNVLAGLSEEGLDLGLETSEGGDALGLDLGTPLEGLEDMDHGAEDSTTEDTEDSLNLGGDLDDLGLGEDTETAVTTDESEDEDLGDLGLDHEEESLTPTEKDELNLEDGPGEEELDFGDSLEDTTAAETEEETDSSLDELDMGDETTAAETDSSLDELDMEDAMDEDLTPAGDSDEGLSLDNDLSLGLEDTSEITEAELPTTEDDDLSSLDLDNNDAATDEDASLSLGDDDLSSEDEDMDLGDDSEVSAPTEDTSDEELLDFGEEEIASTIEADASEDLSLDLDSDSPSSDSPSDAAIDNEDEFSLEDDLLDEDAGVAAPVAEETEEGLSLGDLGDHDVDLGGDDTEVAATDTDDLSLDGDLSMEDMADASSEVEESLSIPDEEPALEEDDLSLDTDEALEEEATPLASADEDDGNLDLAETGDLSLDEDTDSVSSEDSTSEETEELSLEDDFATDLGETESETTVDEDLSLGDDDLTMDEDTDTNDSSSTTSKDSKDSDELSLDDDELSLGDLDEEEAAATEVEDELSSESEPDSSLEDLESDDLSMESEDDGLSMESADEELSMEMDDNLSLDDNTNLMTDELDSHTTDNDDSATAITDDELSLGDMDMDNMDMGNMDMDNNSDDTVMPSTDDDLGLGEEGAADDDVMDMSSLGLDDELAGELGNMDDDLSSDLGELPDDADMMSSGDGDDIQSKFDLAQMYIDIEDADSARTTLEEIIAEGDAEQRRKAETMMKKLA